MLLKAIRSCLQRIALVSESRSLRPKAAVLRMARFVLPLFRDSNEVSVFAYLPPVSKTPTALSRGVFLTLGSVLAGGRLQMPGSTTGCSEVFRSRLVLPSYSCHCTPLHMPRVLIAALPLSLLAWCHALLPSRAHGRHGGRCSPSAGSLMQRLGEGGGGPPTAKVRSAILGRIDGDPELQEREDEGWRGGKDPGKSHEIANHCISRLGKLLVTLTGCLLHR